MTNAIVALQMRLRVFEANEPVNRAQGNIDQADYEKAAIPEIREAIAVLIAADIERKRASPFADKPAQLGSDRPPFWGLSATAAEVVADKRLRKDINTLTQQVKALPGSRERSLAVTKLQEATMWLGMDLKRIGEANPGLVANPYPNSKNPDSPVIEPTADGLKM